MIAVDWGTSSLRLYRLDAAGMVLERASAAQLAQLARMLADQFVWLEPEHLRIGSIDESIAPITIVLGNRNRRNIRHQPQLRLTRPQRRNGAIAFGDVAGQHHEPRQVAG